ncbi:MAG: glycoside hydrolase family 3 protein, partial [Micrococcales bacterium]|nr:glycoside hydrolase family 3 protein [Micrococcales bacterium]
MRIRAQAVIGVVLLLSACGGAGDSPPVPSGATSNEAYRTTPPAPEAPDRAVELWQQMTVEQRAGQLIMVAVHAGKSQDAARALVTRRGVGSVILLGNTWGGAAAVSQTTGALQGLAPVPLLVATDQEGGQVQHLTGAGFSAIPSGVQQGAMAPDALEAAAAGWAGELAAAGVNFDLAPVVDLVEPARRADNAPIGALDRDFGHDGPGNAASASAVVAGMREAHVGTCVKHFPGLGTVTGNTDNTAQGIVDSQTTKDAAVVRSFATVLDQRPT